MKYVQCLLCKFNDITPKTVKANTTVLEQTTYLPDEFAVLNKVLKLKNDEGKWENGWIVMKVYPDSETKLIPDSHIRVKKHRKNTGDSMPKKKKT